jgi:DMSO/TMAO reductase YedYZ molybdopterin-dependent catalytic subunit
MAVPLIALTLWHAWHFRFIRRVPCKFGRRFFFGAVLVSTAGFFLWVTTNRLKAWIGLAGAGRRFTGSYKTGSFTPDYPVVSWIADRPPPVVIESWELRIDGQVERPIRYTYEELISLPQAEMTTTLDCTGGWYTVQKWRGIRVGDLLDRAGIYPDAASITFEAVSGYKRRFDLSEAGGYLLALGTEISEGSSDFQTLSHGHGFPVRLVVPDKRGMEWVKWFTVIKVNGTGPAWQSPLPLQ